MVKKNECISESVIACELILPGSIFSNNSKVVGFGYKNKFN